MGEKVSEEKGERGTEVEEMNGFWKRSAGREGGKEGEREGGRRGNQSCEEREESAECDFTAEDRGIRFALPTYSRVGMMHQNQ